MGVHHRTYEAQVRQRGGGVNRIANRPCLPQQLEQALQRAIQQQVATDPMVAPDNDLFIYLGSNTLRSAYHSQRCIVRNWQEGEAGSEEILQQMSRMLNSSDSFKMDNTFNLHVIHVRNPGRGRG